MIFGILSKRVWRLAFYFRYLELKCDLEIFGTCRGALWKNLAIFPKKYPPQLVATNHEKNDYRPTFTR